MSLVQDILYEILYLMTENLFIRAFAPFRDTSRNFVNPDFPSDLIRHGCYPVAYKTIDGFEHWPLYFWVHCFTHSTMQHLVLSFAKTAASVMDHCTWEFKGVADFPPLLYTFFFPCDFWNFFGKIIGWCFYPFLKILNLSARWFYPIQLICVDERI